MGIGFSSAQWQLPSFSFAHVLFTWSTPSTIGTSASTKRKPIRLPWRSATHPNWLLLSAVLVCYTSPRKTSVNVWRKNEITRSMGLRSRDADLGYGGGAASGARTGDTEEHPAATTARDAQHEELVRVGEGSDGGAFSGTGSLERWQKPFCRTTGAAPELLEFGEPRRTQEAGGQADREQRRPLQLRSKAMGRGTERFRSHHDRTGRDCAISRRCNPEQDRSQCRADRGA